MKLLRSIVNRISCRVCMRLGLCRFCKLAALAEAVEAYTTNQKPFTFDLMEQEMLKAKKMLEGVTT